MQCRGIVAAWGLGGEPFYFPEDAGYPLGNEHGGATYYMFEVSTQPPPPHPRLNAIINSSGYNLIYQKNTKL